MIEFFKKIIAVFEKNKIPYMVSGSFAYGLYALPRMSRDFDFVIHLNEADIIDFANAFKDGNYCNEGSIIDAVKRKSIFNIIDFSSGYKADFIILKNDIFKQTEFNRRIRGNILGINVWVVTVEDLIISKFLWIQELQSGIQIDDLKELIKYKNLDLQYVKKWITDLQLNTFNIL